MINPEDLIDEPPSAIDPYEVLEIDSGATASQVTAAYRKAALRHHPGLGNNNACIYIYVWRTDKAKGPNKAQAHVQFQQVAFAYAILSDDRRRQRYDLTGSTAESLNFDDDDDDGFNWQAFYKAQYADVVSGDAIQRFKAEYQGSPEELGHLLDAYELAKGDLDHVYSVVMLSDPRYDEDRFQDILHQQIATGAIQPYKAFMHESKARRRNRITAANREGSEAIALAKTLGVEQKLFGSSATSSSSKPDDSSDTSALAALIRSRQAARASNFLDALESKYVTPRSRSSSKPSSQTPKRKLDGANEPPEEAFQKTGARGKKAKSARGNSKAAMENDPPPSAKPRRSQRTKQEMN